jgi:hypothetical protein
VFTTVTIFKEGKDGDGGNDSTRDMVAHGTHTKYLLREKEKKVNEGEVAVEER